MNLLRGSSLTLATDCPTRPALGHLDEGLTFSQVGPEKRFHLHWDGGVRSLGDGTI